MAYSDYGSFVYRNGERRTDKEDVGVFDTDESSLPSGFRIYANILKNRANSNNERHNHSHHGVIGDGASRVACYKQGWPTIYHWKENDDVPTCVGGDALVRLFGWQQKDFVHSYDSQGVTKYYIDYDYPDVSFDYEGHKFLFSSGSPYEAEMTEPDGTQWMCSYDYGYGAGLTD